MRPAWYEPALAAVLVAALAGGGRVAAAQTGTAIRIDAEPVPLDPRHPTERAIGDFVYAGGLVLTSRETDRLHGLSDLVVTETDRLLAISDMGMLLEARLVLDDGGQLVGLADARVAPLTGADGRPLADKMDADAEGLALLPSGDRLVSFELRHRIVLYPAAGGVPRPVPGPEATFPPNGGMEALAADPDAGPEAYVVGAEWTGATWVCTARPPGCVPGPTVEKPMEFGLVALRRLTGKRTAYLLRAYDPLRGNRASLRIVGPDGPVTGLDLALPLTVDNLEGLAAVPGPGGATRFYLLSDDNGRNDQRTLLLAFDWLAR